MSGEISASDMHDGRWMFVRRLREPERPGAGAPCEIIGVREYTAGEMYAVVLWLSERAAGYPKLNLAPVPWGRS